MNKLPHGQAVDARKGYTRTIIEDNGPITAVQFESGMGMLLDRVADLCASQQEAMREAVRAGTHEGMRDAAADPEYTKAFWLAGFEQWKNHASEQSSQWVGKRVLTWLIVSLISAGAYWLARNGK